MKKKPKAEIILYVIVILLYQAILQWVFAAWYLRGSIKMFQERVDTIFESYNITVN